MKKEQLSTSTQEVPKLKTALLDKIQAEKKPEKDLNKICVDYEKVSI